MYTTFEKVNNYLEEDLTTKQTEVEEWIEEITQYINTITGTNFNASQGSKYYDGNNRQILHIDDFVSVDTVELDGEVIDVEIPSKSPITRIRYEDYFLEGFENVKVTGLIGYSQDTPKDIERAATIMVAGVINKDGDVTRERIGDYQVQYKDKKALADYENALKIVKMYKKTV